MSFEENLARQRAIIEERLRGIQAEKDTKAAEEKARQDAHELQVAERKKQAELDELNKQQQEQQRIEALKADPRFLEMLAIPNDPSLRAILYLYWEKYGRKSRQIKTAKAVGILHPRVEYSVEEIIDEIPFTLIVEPNFDTGWVGGEQRWDKPVGLLNLYLPLMTEEKYPETPKREGSKLKLTVTWRNTRSQVKIMDTTQLNGEGIVIDIPQFFTKSSNKAGESRTSYVSLGYNFIEISKVVEFIQDHLVKGKALHHDQTWFRPFKTIPTYEYGPQTGWET